MKKAGIILTVFVLTVNVSAGVIFSDDFDDGVLDNAWNVSFDNVTGWTYTESGTELTVTDITMDPSITGIVPGAVTLSRNVGNLSDFTVDCGISWDAQGLDSRIEVLGIYLMSGGQEVAYIAYDDSWVQTTAEKEARIIDDPDYYHSGQGSLPYSGSAVLTITRSQGMIKFYWDGELIHSLYNDTLIDEVAIKFRRSSYYASTFGTLSVDYIEVSEPTVPSGCLVSRYEFNGNADDSVGSKHRTFQNGATTAIDAERGEVLSLDGINDYVSFSDMLVTTTEFTIAAWANMAGTGGGEEFTNTIFSQRDDLTGDNYCAIVLAAEAISPGSAAGIRSSNGTMQVLYSSVQDYGEWHHYAMTVSSDHLSYYVDGHLVDQIVNTQLGDYTTSIDYVQIGKRRFNGRDRGFLNGMIDDVRVYDHALSQDEINSFFPIEVAVDIKPGNCYNPVNVKSKGVLPVVIYGSEYLDVNSIDVASIKLAGVNPIRSSYEDISSPVADVNDCNAPEYMPDGFVDLKLKFDTQQILGAIGDVNDGDFIELQLNAVLYDETIIYGSDFIEIKGFHKAPKKADLNTDGIVDLADFAILTEDWLQ